jgi:hypothetical protein
VGLEAESLIIRLTFAQTSTLGGIRSLNLKSDNTKQNWKNAQIKQFF